MTFEAAPFQNDVAATSRKTVSLRSAPVQLREGVHTFLSLAKLHPDLHPAVLASILARPACERRSLLEAARASAESKLCSSYPAEQKQAKQAKQGAGPPGSAETLSSDSDEVWEDALEDLDSAAKKQRFQSDAVDMARVVLGGAGGAPSARLEHLEHLELEAADCHRAWQETRQLGAWTRYTECRKRLAELKDKERRQAKRAQDEEERAQQEAKWSQLEALREVHERRLAELNRRRERLRLSRQYHEQTRLHHAQLAQAQLQQQLRELEQRQELRRLQHLKRVQQLVQELAASDGDRTDIRQPARAASASMASTPSPAPEDVFTHMWDDFSHWEKMVSDDKEHLQVEAEERPATSCSTVSSTVSSTTSLPPFANQPDVIPIMPPPVGVPAVCSAASAASAGPWRQRSTSTASVGSVGSVGGYPLGEPHAGPHVGRRHSVAADGFQERKKWFEEALLSWHAQDDEEDFGTSLYASSSTPLPPVDAFGTLGGRGSRAGSDHSDHGHHVHHGHHGHHVSSASPWHHAAWSAWPGPATSTY